MSLTVSVVIPNYNYGRFLREAIESALCQTHKPLEVIVVDDGSTDESQDILHYYKGKGVRAIRQLNSGVGSARNRGARESRGDVIAFLDADDIWFPDKLERQVAVFEDDIETGLVSCGMEEFDSYGEIIKTYDSSPEGWISNRIITFDIDVIASGSAIAVRRTVFESIGGFDERKEMHPSEDWEFFYRISRVSKVGFVKRLLVKYRNHGDNGHLQILRFETAMRLVYEKIFHTSDGEILQLRRKAYGNLYKILAGSYFYSKQYMRFFLSTVKSVWLAPENIIYFIYFPVRRMSTRDKDQTS